VTMHTPGIGAELSLAVRRDAGGRRGGGHGSFLNAMLACLTHWYTSLLYVVPVLTVGGWGWWSARRVNRRQAPSAESRQA
jgi:hypothetical protein